MFFQSSGIASTLAGRKLIWKAAAVISAFCSKYRSVRTRVGIFFFVRLLSASLCISSHAQSQQPNPIEFSNSTTKAGLKFIHFKGNNGVSINREEFGPG